METGRTLASLHVWKTVFLSASFNSIIYCLPLIVLHPLGSTAQETYLISSHYSMIPGEMPPSSLAYTNSGAARDQWNKSQRCGIGHNSVRQIGFTSQLTLKAVIPTPAPDLAMDFMLIQSKKQESRINRPCQLWEKYRLTLILAVSATMVALTTRPRSCPGAQTTTLRERIPRHPLLPTTMLLDRS